MQERSSSKASWVELTQPAVNVEPMVSNQGHHEGAAFDHSLSDLKKLQSASKFKKARFSFKLYKRGFV